MPRTPMSDTPLSPVNEYYKVLNKRIMEEKIQEEYVIGVSGRKYPIARPINQNGLKRDIIKLVLNLATPDDDCMLSDFLHALQFVLNKHSNQSTLDRYEKALNRIKDCCDGNDTDEEAFWHIAHNALNDITPPSDEK